MADDQDHARPQRTAPEPPPSPALSGDDGPPGRGHLGPAVERFDEDVDAWLERLRGHPGADALFTTASHLGDWSLVWHLAGAARVAAGAPPRQLLALSALLGVESLIVNQGLKRLFRRQRPTQQGDTRFRVRRPVTSSFPSGHASSAAFAAVVLTGWDGPRSIPLWWGLAGIVGTSRAYVRIHHASDVVAGAVVGVVLGLGARQLLRAAELR